MKLAIRKCQVEDIDDLFKLVQEFAVSFSPIKSDFIKSFNNLVNDDASILLVSVLDKELVGYCLGFDHFAFYSNGRVSCLEEIMVVKKYQKAGIGSQLIQEFENWCMSRGSVLISVSTRRAAEFYESLGYEKSATYFRKIL